jgi:hypothetical protein
MKRSREKGKEKGNFLLLVDSHQQREPHCDGRSLPWGAAVLLIDAWLNPAGCSNGRHWGHWALHTSFKRLGELLIFLLKAASGEKAPGGSLMALLEQTSLDANESAAAPTDHI